jgi:SWI/SNF-related matrix-associated actin-dependent regulator 1 of chromatin subfamily A
MYVYYNAERDRFEASSTYKERFIIKDAGGWWWDRNRKVWYAPRLEVVPNLSDYMTKDAKEKYNELVEQAKEEPEEDPYITYNPVNKIFTWHGDKSTKDIPSDAKFVFDTGPNSCKRYLYGDGCFYCERNAGFGWHTNQPARALKLWDYCDDDAKAALEEYKEGVEASEAEIPDDPNVEIPAPEGIEFRPYQKAGILYAMNPGRPKVILGDEMGLGKTPQAIGVANVLEQQLGRIPKVLVVCPASLRVNWFREFQRFSTTPHEYYVHAKSTDKGEKVKFPESATCVITNFERLRQSKKNQEVLQQYLDTDWDLVIIDEVHKLKNRGTQQTQGVLGYYDFKKKERQPGVATEVQKALLLTGTPITNRVTDLHTLLAYINPRKYGKFDYFVQKYTYARKEKVRSFPTPVYAWTNLDSLKNEDVLHADLRACCMVRRLKDDVLTELPRKIKQVIKLDPDAVSGVKQLISKLTVAEGIDPLEDIQGQLQSRKIAFEEIAKARKKIGLKKIPVVVEHVTEAWDAGSGKILLFVHHREVARKLQEDLEKAEGWAKGQTVLITGEVTDTKRQERVDQFQEDENIRVAILSIDAAGVGLTLTAGHTVVFAELPWTPAQVTQAEDRAHRIGQEHQVIVQYLVFDGTIDARIAEALATKQEIADQVLDDDHDVSEEVIEEAEEKQKRAQDARQRLQVIEEVEGSKITEEDLAMMSLTDEQKRAIALAVQDLTGLCDRAFERDDCGWNKMDAQKGHSMAMMDVSEWPDVYYEWGYRALYKYHRQIDERIYATIYGDTYENLKAQKKKEVQGELEEYQATQADKKEAIKAIAKELRPVYNDIPGDDPDGGEIVEISGWPFYVYLEGPWHLVDRLDKADESKVLKHAKYKTVQSVARWIANQLHQDGLLLPTPFTPAPTEPEGEIETPLVDPAGSELVEVETAEETAEEPELTEEIDVQVRKNELYIQRYGKTNVFRRGDEVAVLFLAKQQGERFWKRGTLVGLRPAAEEEEQVIVEFPSGVKGPYRMGFHKGQIYPPERAPEKKKPESKREKAKLSEIVEEMNRKYGEPEPESVEPEPDYEPDIDPNEVMEAVWEAVTSTWTGKFLKWALANETMIKALIVDKVEEAIGAKRK